MTSADILHQLPNLNPLDKRVLAAIDDFEACFDCFGYPALAAVARVARTLHEDELDQEIYYSLKTIKTRLRDLHAGKA